MSSISDKMTEFLNDHIELDVRTGYSSSQTMVADYPTLLKIIESASDVAPDGETSMLFERVWNYILSREYGTVSKSSWGLPQVAVWISDSNYKQISLIGEHSAEGTSASEDASALVPTNLTAKRLADLVRNQSSYAHIRFMLLYNMMRSKQATSLDRGLVFGELPAISMQRAAAMVTPVAIDSSTAHRTYWVNGIPFRAPGEDYYPLTFYVKVSTGAFSGNHYKITL